MNLKKKNQIFHKIVTMAYNMNKWMHKVYIFINIETFA
jgi:hypothetical protein